MSNTRRFPNWDEAKKWLWQCCDTAETIEPEQSLSGSGYGQCSCKTRQVWSNRDGSAGGYITK